MRYFFSLCVLFIFTGIVFAQPFANEPQPVFKPNTYAVVIGISAYADPDITTLEFSNRDATVFADFLMSASGGSVPRQNIKLLIDSGATSGEVDKAIRWLKSSCQKDDIVYFYFSGHGALENVTMYKNGYLICYNSPAAAFTSMALSIDYLNDVANTLAVETKANVVMITDACHSGKMAGSKFKGNYLVGEQLLAAKKNEIRMASCTPDQLSNEKKDWGGGRGVFSYHLINGLQGGLADKDQNKTVSLGELKTYMESAMANDPVLKSDGEVQTPVIKAEKMDFVLSTVVQAEAVIVQQMVKEDSVANALILTASSIPGDMDLEPEDLFFNLFKNENLEVLTRDLKLDSIAAETIALTLINNLQAKDSIGSIKTNLEVLKQQLYADKAKLEEFNISISRAITDKGQDVIIRYLKGDEAELEKRRYYNANSSGYDIYPRMFATALKLSQGDKYLSNTTAVLMHYFTGVTLRLKIPLTVDPKQLIEAALREQQKALALHEHAAYIYNELAILKQYKKDYKEAEALFIKATHLSPRWAIPFSNLCGLYAVTGKYPKASAACHMADSLQSGLQSVLINQAFIYEKTGNNLFAEELYRNAIDINSRHFLPFERLGYLYMSTTHYAMADSLFYEADLRKKGYHFKANDFGGIVDAQDQTARIPYLCSFKDTLKFKPDDMMAWFAWGMAELYGFGTALVNADGVAPHVAKNNAGAIQKFRKVISLDKHNPLVYHYLGIAYYEQQQWEEAELMFRYAIANYMSKESFEQYFDSVKNSAVYPYDHDCYENIFRNYYYPQTNNFYFLASLYEKWGQPVEAEAYYKKIIENGTRELGVYMKYWQLLEKQGLYLQAEHVLKNCEPYYRDTIYREFNAFYRRIIEKEPGTADWYYKLGLLLYNHADEPSIWKGADTILWYPKINKERFVPEFTWKTSLDESGKMVTGIKINNWEDYLLDTGPGTSDKFVDDYVSQPNPENIMVPGTGEMLSLAEDVMYPRFDGILYLKRAADLITEKETLASINYKIAEIYEWAGSKKMAYPYFEKSLALNLMNVNTRIKLVDIYTALYKNKAALIQLDYLNDSSQINFTRRLQLARFNMLAGNFAKANELLKIADSIHPYILPEILNLYGLLNMLSKKNQESISAYKKSLQVQQADPCFNNYSIARLYAKNGNTTQAWKYLNTSVNLGFNYSFVLQNDSYLQSLRKTAKWHAMISGIKMKIYKKEKPTN